MEIDAWLLRGCMVTNNGGMKLGSSAAHESQGEALSLLHLSATSVPFIEVLVVSLSLERLSPTSLSNPFFVCSSSTQFFH